MFYIKVKGYFSSAHNLRNYQGSCENLHGHNWIVEVVFRGRHLDDTGMLFDFRKARQMLMDVSNSLDHRYLNELPAFQEVNPTSEHIARYIFISLRDRLRKEQILSVDVDLVTVWENERSAAMYRDDEE